MSMPGFTADQSLLPTTATYYGSHSLGAAADDLVQPEFLGVIVEAFEKIKDGISQALSKAAEAVGNMIREAGKGGRPIVCGQWVTTLLACRNGGPAYSQVEMMSRCVSSNPSNTMFCSTVSAAIYPLVQKACKESPNQVGSLLGQICKGQ